MLAVKIMKITFIVSVAFATSYLTCAAPVNTTNSSVCYCRVNNSIDDNEFEERTHEVLKDSVANLYTFCDLSDLVRV